MFQRITRSFFQRSTSRFYSTNTQQIPRYQHAQSSTLLNNKLFLATTSSLTAYTLYHTINSVISRNESEYSTPSVAYACGIVGFVGKNEAAIDYLLEGLHILQNRGYDSAGIATIHPVDNKIIDNAIGAALFEESKSPTSGRLHVKNSQSLDDFRYDNNASQIDTPSKYSGKYALLSTKFASKGSTSDSIDLLKKEAPKYHKYDLIGIAHTRWATHGGKTDENAHPHVDRYGRVALVHNGTIENSHQLKEELTEYGITEWTSQTDTEVIVQLIGYYLDQNCGFHEAIKKTLTRLEGTWGLTIIHRDYPNEIIAAKHGSPLVIGIGQDRMFVASELSAFNRHTNQYISLKEGEVAVVRADGVSLDLARIEHAPKENIQLSPAPYEHWTLKEIMEQPEAISRALNYGARFDHEGFVKLGGMEDNKEMLLGIKHLLIAACGTSLYASTYGALLFQSLHCFNTVQTIDAAEVTPDSFPLSDAGLLVISQSGETKDTHRALTTAAAQLIPKFSIVNQVGSLIARTTNCGVYLNAGREHAVASTKAFTTQVTALSLIAGWFSQNRESPNKIGKQRRSELIESIHRLPIYCGMTLQCHKQCKRIASTLYKVENLFVLGKGYAEPIAKEGALKIKEITYIHAEGYGGGALKHGPFALLSDQVPVILIILDDPHAELMRIAAAETRARGTRNIIITDKKSLAANGADPDDVIVVPHNGPLTALLAVVPLQLLAYEMAILKGYNPDKPRNLAKAVTVD